MMLLMVCAYVGAVCGYCVGARHRPRRPAPLAPRTILITLPTVHEVGVITWTPTVPVADAFTASTHARRRIAQWN